MEGVGRGKLAGAYLVVRINSPWFKILSSVLNLGHTVLPAKQHCSIQ